jgi:hypothetical protein
MAYIKEWLSMGSASSYSFPRQKSPRNYSFWVLPCPPVVSYTPRRDHRARTINRRATVAPRFIVGATLGRKSDASLPNSYQRAAGSALVCLVRRADDHHRGERRNGPHRPGGGPGRASRSAEQSARPAANVAFGVPYREGFTIPKGKSGVESRFIALVLKKYPKYCSTHNDLVTPP